MKKAPIALLLAVAAAAILSASASAITLKHHVVIPHGVTHKADVHRVVVTTVAPPDSDDDGYANSEDNCPSEPYSSNGGCEPEPVITSYSETTPALTDTSVTTTTAGGCPSYMAAEATSPTAVNPTSGAAGCFQVTPGTQAAMGAACSDVNSSTCVAAICAAQGNEAWAASGATPCG